MTAPNFNKYSGTDTAEILSTIDNQIDYMPPSLKNYVTIPQHTRKKWQSELSSIYHIYKNGDRDPVTVTFVLDLLMKLRETDIIRSRFLVALLKQMHPHIFWDSVTVGRILGELASMSESRWPCDRDCAGRYCSCDNRKLREIQRSKDWQGHKFRIDYTADSWAWLERMRDGVAANARKMMDQERTGQVPTRQGSAFGGINWQSSTVN